MDIKGKGVFLTGGATGIGKSVLELLLQRGARVFFCDVNDETGNATQDEMRQKLSNCDVTFANCDVSDAQQLMDTFERAVRQFGAVEICINNAGIMGENIWERMIAVNQVGMIRGSLLALEHMRKDKGGRGGIIINTASVNALYYGQSLFPVYLATKKAVLGFTSSWANNPDQAEHDVRWGCVCPDATVTPLTDGRWEGRLLKHPIISPHLTRPNPDKSRWLRPGEVAAAFITLIDDPDSNGDVIRVYRERKSDEVGNPSVMQEVLMMDKSEYPITKLVVKKTIVTPVE